MVYTADVHINARYGRKKFPGMTVKARTTMDAVKFWERYFDYPVLSVHFH